MTSTASKRHRWPKHERVGECEYEDHCLDCGLLKRSTNPRPPCPGTSTSDDDYLTKLRENMADPNEAPWYSCQTCGRTFAARSWPASGDEELAAFLDGLGDLAKRTSKVVYGFWLLPVNGEIPKPSEDQPVQLWRGNDRQLVMEGANEAAVLETTQHRCPGWAQRRRR
jgi:hypothetical protein